MYCSGHGDGEGTHLSVYTQLLDVPYHDHLQWPFRGTVAVKLWDYETIIKYHNSEGKPGGDPCGDSRFISVVSIGLKLLYLSRDALHFKLTIQEHSE